MEPPVTPKSMPASSPNLPTNHIGKMFGIVYIILTGVIVTIILAASLWSWLAPLLWWALPTKNPAQVIPETDGPAAKDWIPDTNPNTGTGSQVPGRYGAAAGKISRLGYSPQA
ncbi:hypothetical protein DSO57_1000917 [Entomophthora muscae]|uniref:Uncharacterized protein n=1 Tax=Entomophthora muscae TaxID=34485 RepID=A0ACC2TJX5_9FUNG|nr:hypothetical protein DSO57_1000917 [Entomophthora muscae]